MLYARFIIDNPPAGYRNKDAADIELEKIQGKPTDKLGQISGSFTRTVWRATCLSLLKV